LGWLPLEVFALSAANCDANRRFKLKKRTQLFIRSHNETLSIITMCVCNPDCSAFAI
jgi:hypothetical protein